MKVTKKHIGLAAELRVMSELLLRGHNPAKSYLEIGADLILESGKRIEIKSAHLLQRKSSAKGHGTSSVYLFSFRGGRRPIQKLDKIDYVICWCINEDLFYIIPSKEIASVAVQICDTSPKARHKYNSYRENWKILK